jgi:DNA-binding MarR family transcriptional regulator
MSYLLKNSSQVVNALEHTARSIKDKINHQFKELDYDISYDQWQVIQAIEKNEGRTQIAIAKDCDKEPASICRTIKYLRKRGLVTKTKDESNKRINRIYLTEKGRHLSRKAHSCFEIVSKNCFDNIFDREVNILIKLLDRIQSNYPLVQS